MAGLALSGGALYTGLSHAADRSDLPAAHSKANRFVLHEQASVGLCPWRDPDHDRHAFFPTATDVREETLILSGRRLEVARRLGRQSSAEDNALKVYRILKADHVVGSVVARRVRGESGVIELLLAVGPDGKVLGARIQRLREPQAVASTLQSASWLGAFVGKSSASLWRPGTDFPEVPSTAHSSATAVLDAARTLLVLLAVADSTPEAGAARR